MRNSTVNSIIKPHRTIGESKYMLEEIYLSDVCIDMDSDKPPEDLINPQNAYFNNGRYYYQLPAMWFHSTCNNKAIGLRSIRLIPDSVSFKLNFDIYDLTSPAKPIANFYIIGQYLSTTSIMEIMSDIASRVTNNIKDIARQLKLEDLESYSFLWFYNNLTNNASFNFISEKGSLRYEIKISEDILSEDNIPNNFQYTFNRNLPLQGTEFKF